MAVLFSSVNTSLGVALLSYNGISKFEMRRRVMALGYSEIYAYILREHPNISYTLSESNLIEQNRSRGVT